MLEEFRAKGIRFYTLKERPVLTPEDTAARNIWVDERKSRSKEGWQKKPHAIIDNTSNALPTMRGATTPPDDPFGVPSS